MKLLFLFLILFSVNAYALDECYTGQWFKEAGEGIYIEVLSEDRIVGNFFTYDQDGYQRWFVLGFGENDFGPVISTNMYGEAEQEVGAASLDAIDSKTLLFVWDITMDLFDPPWCLNYTCVGELVMTRLTGSCD